MENFVRAVVWVLGELASGGCSGRVPKSISCLLSLAEWATWMIDTPTMLHVKTNGEGRNGAHVMHRVQINYLDFPRKAS